MPMAGWVPLKQISVVVVLFSLMACAEATPPPVVVAEAPDVIDLKAASDQVAVDLARQLGPARDRTISIDPLLDRTTGQQTAASLRAQGELAAALTTSMKGATIQPLKALAPEPTRAGGDRLRRLGGTTRFLRAHRRPDRPVERTGRRPVGGALPRSHTGPLADTVLQRESVARPRSFGGRILEDR